MILNYFFSFANNISEILLFIINFYNLRYLKKFDKNELKKNKQITNKKYKILIICNYCKREIKNEIYNLYDNPYCSNICRKEILKKFD